MDNTLQELRTYIKASECSSSMHAAIPAYIEKKILNDPGSQFKNRVPPLDIIIYAIKRLLANSPIVVPDLLDFTTTVEFYRKLALQKADDALKIHQSYRADDYSATTLTGDEVERLQGYQMNDSTLREIYIELVLNHCQLVCHLCRYSVLKYLNCHLPDIYHVRTSDPPRTADLESRLCEYFPELYRDARGESSLLFHSDLTQPEREVVRFRGADSFKFLRDSYDWACANQISGQTLESVFQTSEFAIAFPCKIHPPTLRETVELYMETVERMVNELQEMFPQN
ncbi:hypothetical protein GGX14DRAFT_580858 [Mycena pura]|uniref:Uncharacterized protein n=1 Tax=Mycena pura TaxID=153505 RepID=A0AAD6UP74_9AGAR|nr:hypothetical protein GGX14DRAFT_580858 [Mycena pura]